MAGLPVPGLEDFIEQFHLTAPASTNKILETEVIRDPISVWAIGDWDSGSLTIHELPSRLQAAAFSVIVEECIDKIKILGFGDGLPSVETTLDFQSLSQKYGGDDQQSFIFDPDTLEPYEGSQNKQMMVKFQKDRSYIEQVLEEANDDLVRNCTINTFIKRLEHYKLNETGKKSLLKETLKNTTTLMKLSQQYELDRIRLRSNLEKQSDKLWKIKNDYEDMIYENEIKVRYINSWESARRNQNEVSLGRKTEQLRNAIKKGATNYENENRVNYEIESYLSQTAEMYQDDIEKWMDKYDKDFDSTDMQVQILSDKRDEQSIQMQNLKRLYEAHEQEIDDYLEMKRLIQEEKELLAEMNKAATKIQAWWRGTMYRKGLGRYRKRKHKQHKGKKGKEMKKK